MLAVDALLSDMVNGPDSPWKRAGEQTIERSYGPGGVWSLRHFPLLAQGNVVAAAELAKLFHVSDKKPDYVVFYGCAGAARKQDLESAFLVDGVNYLSLGTVRKRNSGGEGVTLKSKWLSYTLPPADAKPLLMARFPLCSDEGEANFSKLSGIPTARVAATDKVIQVAPGAPPPILASGPPNDLYAKREWTYSEALALVAKYNETLLVEMESYGIARLALALDLLEKVLVLRVTTDSLEDHGQSDDSQFRLLMEGRHVLARLLAVLFGHGFDPP